MRAIIVDDEALSAEYLEMLCMGVQGLEIVGSFRGVPQALEFLSQNEADLAFLDIEMPGMNGLQGAEKFRELRPDMGVVFVTGYEQYALDAFRADAVAYLLKPCDQEELKRAVGKAAKLIPPPRPRVRVQTFGHFVVFFDGEPFRFSNGKAKELLALMVDRQGGVVSMEQAADLLWENRPYDDTVKQLYRKAIIYLHQVQRDRGLEFFISNRGSCHVIPSKLDCDYFRLMAGDREAEKLYSGEYLSDYSWAEETIGRIEHYLERRV